MNTEFSVRIADWAQDAAKLKTIRYTVFVIEQDVPEALEWDGVDPDCRHVIAEDAQGAPIGCGRLLPDGHIGRMAVIRGWRGKGVGGALLERLIELARDSGHPQAVLNAQRQAARFYRRYGFAQVGEPFEEAGIPHVEMVRGL